MVRLLTLCRRFFDLTGGAFDVSVQPLWRLYAEHFANTPDGDRAPAPAAIARALGLVDYSRIDFSPARIGLGPGMALTLNGVAQGYITDRVADLLRDRGWSNVLIDLGETRALDNHPRSRPWRLGIEDAANPGKTIATVPLDNRAAATSAGHGAAFDRQGRHHHLFDPRTGLSSRRYGSITVVANEAATADALSTAFYSMSLKDAKAVLGRIGGAEAWILEQTGNLKHLKG
jgi:thiamine biosynthesis lipoprotein